MGPMQVWHNWGISKKLSSLLLLLLLSGLAARASSISWRIRARYLFFLRAGLACELRDPVVELFLLDLVLELA